MFLRNSRERAKLDEQWYRREVLNSRMDDFGMMQLTMTAALQKDRQAGVSKTFLDPGLPLCGLKGDVVEADSYVLIEHVVRSYATVQMTIPSVVGGDRRLSVPSVSNVVCVDA